MRSSLLLSVVVFQDAVDVLARKAEKIVALAQYNQTK
jgi:hypothetical protein